MSETDSGTAQPMTPEKLAEIRLRYEWLRGTEPELQLRSLSETGELLAEVDRLQAELAQAHIAIQSERDHMAGYRAEMQAGMERLRREAADNLALATAVEAREEQALEIVRAVAMMNDVTCLCPGREHGEWCPVRKARALLAAVDGEREPDSGGKE